MPQPPTGAIHLFIKGNVLPVNTATSNLSSPVGLFNIPMRFWSDLQSELLILKSILYDVLYSTLLLGL